MDSTSGVLSLQTDHTYTVPPPKLEPKERMFVGYAAPLGNADALWVCSRQHVSMFVGRALLVRNADAH